MACNSSTVFVQSVYACVSRTLADRADFRAALIDMRTCPGGTFTSALALERLRLCNVVAGSIIIENVTEAIEPTLFWDIVAIEGAHVCV